MLYCRNVRKFFFLFNARSGCATKVNVVFELVQFQFVGTLVSFALNLFIVQKKALTASMFFLYGLDIVRLKILPIGLILWQTSLFPVCI